MERGERTRNQRKTKTNEKQLRDKEDEGNMPEVEDDGADEEHMETEVTEAVRSGLRDVAREIQSFKTELRATLSTFKEEFKREMKEELEYFKQDFNQRLAETAKELATQATRITETEQRVSETETWSMEANEALLEALKQQRALQEKLTDQEGRSRRNNIRIFGLPEDAEGSSMLLFVETLLRTELSLPSEIELQIQRAHRALAPKPSSGQPPRSTVVNFLQYTVKETVLKKAWQKKIQYQGRTLSFDHDYAMEVNQKRKEYIGIKKALKERGIRFQTPLTKMRIHWEGGPRTYGNAREAAEDLRRRGIEVEIPSSNTATVGIEERLRSAMSWQRAGNHRETAERAKSKLKEFQRK
ncbi:hypothetical protein NFI96_008937 [Prochilodus magdalenae]|nr:hypothetical protein NFI96_008937 [Prochilodus magdalenae]